MTSRMADDEYREIELYLRQAQEEISHALSHIETQRDDALGETAPQHTGGGGGGNWRDAPHNATRNIGCHLGLSDVTGHVTTSRHDVNDNPEGQVPTATIPEDLSFVRADLTTVGADFNTVRADFNTCSADLTTVTTRSEDITTNKGDITTGGTDLTPVSLDTDTTKHTLQTMDFLSIFAQNDLILEADHDALKAVEASSSSLLLGRSVPDWWNRTLPNPRPRPDRPKTLTPPPSLHGGGLSGGVGLDPHNPYRHQDWRLYVRSDHSQSIVNDCGRGNAGGVMAHRGVGRQCGVVNKVAKPLNPHVTSVRRESHCDGSGTSACERGRGGGVVSDVGSAAPVKLLPIRTRPGDVGLNTQTPRSKVCALDNENNTRNINNNLHNGVQRPKSMSDESNTMPVHIANVRLANSFPQIPTRPLMKAREDVPAMGSPGDTRAKRQGKDDVVKDKRAVQTENVVESLPAIRSPTIERRSMNGPSSSLSSSSSKCCKETVVVGNCLRGSDNNNKESTRVSPSKKDSIQNTAKKCVVSESPPFCETGERTEADTCSPTRRTPMSDFVAPMSVAHVQKRDTGANSETMNVDVVLLNGVPSPAEALSCIPDDKRAGGVQTVRAASPQLPASPTRTGQPALAIPPPPTMEDDHKEEEERAVVTPPTARVILRDPSKERRRRPMQPRTRSNSGGEVELGIIRTERRAKSAFEKVSTSTQTEKRGERRRKSDPGYLSKSVLKAARIKYMGHPAYLQQAGRLDSDNNNIMVVKPHRRDADNNDRNMDINNRKRANNWSNVIMRMKKSSRETNVVVANTQETQCKLVGGGGGGRQTGSDITVQVEVYVSCNDKDRCDPRCNSRSDSGRWTRDRRVSAKPLMPVIAEVQKNTDDDESDTPEEAFDSSTGSLTQSAHCRDNVDPRRGHVRSLSSTTSNSDRLPSPDISSKNVAPPLPPRRVRARPKKPPLLEIRPPPPDLPPSSLGSRGTPGSVGLSAPGSPMPASPRSPLSSTSSSGSAVSLLDSLHRRYYPGMYHYQHSDGNGVEGDDDVPNTNLRHSNPEVSTTSTLTAHEQLIVPHSKSASFAEQLPLREQNPRSLRENAPLRQRPALDQFPDADDNFGGLSLSSQKRVGELLAQLNSAGGATVGSPSSSICTLPRSPLPARPVPIHLADSSEAESSSYGSLSSAKNLPATCTDGCTSAGDQTLRTIKSDREHAEIEAVEACKWLRAAGFPQYAQMYEDQLFPIDIASVEKDHDFLDTDSIQSLFRRLNTLNKCANMKIEAPPRKSGDESDEEEQCALSDRWRFTRSSRRWSRRDLDELLSPDELLPPHDHELLTVDDSLDKSGGLRSCSSHDSVLTDNEPALEESPLQTDRSPYYYRHGSVPDSPSCDPHHTGTTTTLTVPPVSPSAGSRGNEKAVASERRSMSPISPRLRRAASERFRGAKIFLKRIESFKTKKSKKGKSGEARTGAGGKVEISGPVVVDSTSLQERMDRLGCVDISPTSEKRSVMLDPLRAYPAAPASPGASAVASQSHSKVPTEQQAHPHRQSSSPGGGGAVSPLNKRDGRVFLDSSSSNSSFPSGSSSGLINDLPRAHGSGATSEEAPQLHNLDHLTPPVCPASRHRRNHSSSDIRDITDMYSASSADPKQQGSSFPMLVSNGYIEVGNGSQINYRTGSFNMGNESEDYKESFIRRTTAKHSVAGKSLGSSPNSPATPLRQTVVTPLDQSSPHRENRLSVYDNVPTSVENTNAQHELDLILHDLFENINGLSQSLGQCVQDENPKVDSQDDSASHSRLQGTDASDSDQCDVTTTTTTRCDVTMPPAVDKDDIGVVPPPIAGVMMATHHQRVPPSTGDADPDVGSASSSTQELSDGDLTAGSREDDGSDPPEVGGRERRDSGVGSSLTRAPSDRRRHRIRWHSFVKSHRPSLNSRSLQISSMSAGQLMVLRKLSLLKVTALMEKYSPTNRSGWNWIMPKFIKRFKVPDYKDKQVFGVPLLVVLQRTGQPLPQCILYAMRSLRRTARDAVGIFRKSGVRSRIQKLHNQIESNPECVDFDQLQAYDVADLLKQYFRELPECLLTNKLSETFIASFTHVPCELRLDALQAAVMLLPDENREVLQSLLLFLSDMAEHSTENQMTASNLAVCFAPSLFHMCGPRHNPAASPKRNRRHLGVPDQKDLLEQKAAHECLTAMIQDCKSIFSVPEEMLGKCRLSYIEQGDPVCMEELVRRRADRTAADHTAYMEACIQGLLRESHNKFKGWISVSSPGMTDVAYKKVGDGHPLRLWKCAVDVEAPPVEVLNRVLHERHLWDEDLLKWRVVEKLDTETEVFQYVLNNMAPHPTRDITQLRSWRTNLPKGACVLVSTSVEHPEAGLLGGLRAVVLASRYLIEPCGSGKSRLTHMCRIDLRGHTPEWYNKAYGHLCANYVMRIRDSFKQDIDSTAGPETKV